MDALDWTTGNSFLANSTAFQTKYKCHNACCTSMNNGVMIPRRLACHVVIKSIPSKNITPFEHDQDSLEPPQPHVLEHAGQETYAGANFE